MYDSTKRLFSVIQRRFGMRSNRKIIFLLCLSIILNLNYFVFADANYQNIITNGLNIAKLEILNQKMNQYEISTTAKLRDNLPSNRKIKIDGSSLDKAINTQNDFFDALYLLAQVEALSNSVERIKDGAYDNGNPYNISVFETGEKWTYVWTRDVAYSIDLALAAFDPLRSLNSLLFKSSKYKKNIKRNNANMIVQDTGSGGSYPISSDRIVWALGAWETLKHLPDTERKLFLGRAYDILSYTLEQDRRIIYDEVTGLYRGEQSFLDWREQSYPQWTYNNVNSIAVSKTLSVNVLNYIALKITAQCAKEISMMGAYKKYDQWAQDLKSSINNHLLNKEKDSYYAYLLSDGVYNYPVEKKDLLGLSLAIISGIADQSLSTKILNKYPVGPYGPSVIWPQEKNIPIYHNQGIWPFVTAYWIKAAKKAKHYKAVAHGITSMYRLTAVNLSNMENYDFTSGEAEVRNKSINGPVVNSRRQLWSVAGYLSIIENVIFGAEISMEGISFDPFIPSKIKNSLFANTDKIKLINYKYKDTTHNVLIQFPKKENKDQGSYELEKIKLNGKQISKSHVDYKKLKKSNDWIITLSHTRDKYGCKLHHINLSEDDIYSPKMPLLVKNEGNNTRDPNIVYNIYSNGFFVALKTNDFSQIFNKFDKNHSFAVQSVDLQTEYSSHFVLTNIIQNHNNIINIDASEMINLGGQLVNNHHFENWGDKTHYLKTPDFNVPITGNYKITCEYSNGHGPINTGISCGIKKISLNHLNNKNYDYIIMPQLGSWDRYEKSIPVIFHLNADKKYSFKIYEDDTVVNMSYLEHNSRYSAWPGGGDDSCNYVNISKIQIELIE